jgi:hypothetical protein
MPSALPIMGTGKADRPPASSVKSKKRRRRLPPQARLRRAPLSAEGPPRCPDLDRLVLPQLQSPTSSATTARAALG